MEGERPPRPGVLGNGAEPWRSGSATLLLHLRPLSRVTSDLPLPLHQSRATPALPPSHFSLLPPVHPGAFIPCVPSFCRSSQGHLGWAAFLQLPLAASPGCTDFYLLLAFKHPGVSIQCFPDSFFLVTHLPPSYAGHLSSVTLQVLSSHLCVLLK